MSELMLLLVRGVDELRAEMKMMRRIKLAEELYKLGAITKEAYAEELREIMKQ